MSPSVDEMCVANESIGDVHKTEKGRCARVWVVTGEGGARRGCVFTKRG